MAKNSKMVALWVLLGWSVLHPSISMASKSPRNFDTAFKKSVLPAVNVDKAVIYNCRLHEYHALYPYIDNDYLAVIWPKENQKLKLRSKPSEVSWDDYKRAIYRSNMFDEYLNKNGCFRNALHYLSRDDEHLSRVRFLDETTDLMWVIPDENATHYSYDKAKKQLAHYNSTTVEGFDDWRLPTTEEAASLYRRSYGTKSGNESRQNYAYWTADWQGNTVWSSNDRFSSITHLTWQKPHNPLYGKFREQGLMLVRSQPKPYPKKYLAPQRELPKLTEEQLQCKHWERYRGNQKVIRKPDSTEWPSVINAITLRSSPKQFLGADDIDNDKKAHNSPTYGGNWRCFRNYFIDTTEGVVIDLATNLMWQKSTNSFLAKYKNHRKKETYINQLNTDRFADKLGWRTPTVQELLSLMETTSFRNKPALKQRRHLDPIFDQRAARYSTSDDFRYDDVPSERQVIVDFDATLVDTTRYARNDKPAHDIVKAVRTLSHSEIRHYCQQIKGLTCQ
ncbi:hypothetical protein A9Q99_25710 [Gammaproteobacteria bacterium 45_16_T64]|nr:hypothetical protein A9Q99_25710 [Gammaproteobacteria bacterium 45_16_T64]